uniref:Uncharacterized protein n=1 Tax=uncultured prokaryote TaxID=198431 RepID=H5SJX1_9ZZZZ|nr:hypothetical protein HGMM_F38G10C07 [uncultured prokaryote]
METLRSIIALILSWMFVGYLVGGLILWWVMTILIAQLIYPSVNEGERAANYAAWIALFLLLIGAGLVHYLWLGEQWVEVIARAIAMGILPFIGAIWLTATD